MPIISEFIKFPSLINPKLNPATTAIKSMVSIIEYLVLRE
jgi:hypothetical protein